MAKACTTTTTTATTTTTTTATTITPLTPGWALQASFGGTPCVSTVEWTRGVWSAGRALEQELCRPSSPAATAEL